MAKASLPERWKESLPLSPHGEGAPISRHKDVRQRRAQRQYRGQSAEQQPAPAQRRLQQADQKQAQGGDKERSRAEGADAAERARQARNPKRHQSIHSMP